MKASLLIAGALACTLASSASAQPVTGDQKPGTRNPIAVKKQSTKLDPRIEEQARAIERKRQISQQLKASQPTGATESASAANAPGIMALVLPPANDACLSATAISGNGPHAWNNVTATTDGPSNCGIMTKDVWYDWTSGAAGTYVFSLCPPLTVASLDTVITVYTGSGCPVGASIGCNDDFCIGFGPSQVTFTATAATVYKLQIGVYNNGTEGSGTFTVAPPPAAPGNDACAAASPIAGVGSFPFTTVSATTDGPSNCGTIGADVWYNWTNSGASGTYIVSTCGGASYDSILTVYDTNACQGAVLGCNDQACSSNQSRATFPATAGNVYKIQVGGWNGASGAGTFTIGLAPPAPGNDACLSATAISGAGSFAFSNVSATTDGPSNCGLMTNDVWYDWTSGAAGNYIVSLCAMATPYDSVLTVYGPGGACPVGASIVCDDDFCAGFGPSRVVFTATAATVYKIQIGGYNGGEGAGNFDVTLAPPAPANDLCASATAVAGLGSFPFTNVSALTDGPSNCGVMTNDVWFNWTNTGASNVIEVTLCGMATPYDSVVSVYDTNACQGTLLDCDDDFCAFIAPSRVTFPATAGGVYKIQIGGYGGAEGSGNFDVLLGPPPPANDGCAAFTAISGPGSFPFDNTNATTGTEGQNEAICLAFGSTFIENDIWYKWTAGSTGDAVLATCGQTAVDTKVSVYPGTPACPANGSSIVCNDDTCGLQSSVCWPVTSGTTYTIQLGTFPGAAGGTGNFNISTTAASTCMADDGTTEDSLGWGAGGEIAWVQRFGPNAGSTNVSSVQIVWGNALFPGFTPGDGAPAKVLLYDDPNNDGVPDDLTLTQLVNTTVTNVDTDTFVTVPVTPVVMSGLFFAGGGMIHASGDFVAPMDTTSCLNDVRSWFFGDNTGAAVNYNSPQSNVQPPVSFDANGTPANLLVRSGCSTSPMVGECFPGVGGVITCPCPSQAPSNPSGGCANHGAGSTAGGVLSAAGAPDVSADTLVITSSGMRPTASVLNVFFSFKPGTGPGTSTPSTGLVSGAGVRCLGTATMSSLKRLYTVNATGGSVSKPGMGDQSVSVRSATFAGHAIVPPETRHYFNVYRDGQASQTQNCNSPAVTTNLTNMGAVTWVP